MPEEVWTVGAALEWVRGYLASKGDAQPRVSAEWLLSAATGLSRVELYVNFERPLDADERARLREGVRRRAAGEPLQYVTGEVAFRHLVLTVRPGVLIPRPETEVLVEEALSTIAGCPHPRVIEIGVGSGCVVLSILREHAGATAWAGDISDDAIALARENAARTGLADRVTIERSDVFERAPADWRGRVDLVVSNPPYVPRAALGDLPPEVAEHEPRVALDGGPDGLALFRRIAREALDWLAPGGSVVLELDERTIRGAAREAEKWYVEVRVVADLAGRDRVLVARSPRPVGGGVGTDGSGQEADRHGQAVPSGSGEPVGRSDQPRRHGPS